MRSRVKTTLPAPMKAILGISDRNRTSAEQNDQF
jgi:hypothetical protein